MGLYFAVAYGVACRDLCNGGMGLHKSSAAPRPTLLTRRRESIDGCLNGAVDSSAFHRRQLARATILISEACLVSLATRSFTTGAHLGAHIHINGVALLLVLVIAEN